MKNLFIVTFTILTAINVNAALFDRGNGMIYDSSLDITWLQDANYAQTSGYDDDGLMSWSESFQWTDNLVYGGYSDWRMASARLIGNNANSYDGSTDIGYNNTRSEIGHLFFELGNLAYYSSTGQIQSNFGVTSSSFIDADTNQNISFLNFQNELPYWEAESKQGNLNFAWHFVTGFGYHNTDFKGNEFYVWAVRDGDVAKVVPVPAAAWLMSSGLTALAIIARRKRNTV